ncbi:putative heavy metal tolerance protein [Diaporthe ampelina]|uniref:Putative heavy metal tolerance protein n=1 Tax=Diaporthe ampelina TaxID=1214573 RepID=A0A0G2FWF5_9PEZI|nr:putative heavy metal tolerance protein [Diaporthe ampelina]
MAPSLDLFLKILYYAYPTLVFAYYVVCYAFATCTLQTPPSKEQHPRRRLMTSLMLVAILTYLSQALLIIFSPSPVRQDAIVGLLACVLVFGLELAILHDTKSPLWYIYLGSYAIALVFDPLLELSSLHLNPGAYSKSVYFVDVSLVSIRLICIITALLTYFAWRDGRGAQEAGTDAERQSLIRKKALGGSEDTLISEYGATDTNSDDSAKSSSKSPECEWERRQRLAKEQRDKRLKETGSWWTYALGFKLFVPYVWPVNNRGLQIRAALVGICLLANNGLNVLIPTQLGTVMDTLTKSYQGDDVPASLWDSPWIQVLIFAGLKLSASEAGISLLRRRLWMPVEFYADRAITEAAHSHVMNLDANFHDTQSLSDVLVAIQNGQSISNMLETICFEALPNLIDLVVAFIYLTFKFGPYEGLITISTSIVFLYISTTVIARLRSARETEISAYFEEHYVLQSGISGWTTVSSFNQVQYEENRYSSAVQDRISKQKVVWVGYYAAHAFQYLVLLGGLLAGSVDFKGVNFSYDNKKQVLKNVNFSVDPGQTIAFVGQTGAGKSTILKLLDRFYDVTEGAIEIDGQDILMNNIRYARLEATDEEVYEACRAAAIHDQILGFAEGYNTRVGERGMKLSGGELQRVAIARAILKQPKIVLLDEATSAIDTETEFQIQHALRRLCKGRTTFIVAHRLSTIVNADRIVVVMNGEISEEGNHETLISAGGKYAELWSKQIFVKPKEPNMDAEGNTGDENSLKSTKVTTKSNVNGVVTEDEGSTENGVKQAEVKTPSGHKKEV